MARLRRRRGDRRGGAVGDTADSLRGVQRAAGSDGPDPPPVASLPISPTRFVVIGGGPGGNSAASHAARLGAEVTVVERDILGGAAHLWDRIPSKAMIATGGAMSFLSRSGGMGLGTVTPRIDVDNLTARLVSIESRLNRSVN